MLLRLCAALIHGVAPRGQKVDPKDEAGALRTAYEYWPNAGLYGELSQNSLPRRTLNRPPNWGAPRTLVRQSSGGRNQPSTGENPAACCARLWPCLCPSSWPGSGRILAILCPGHSPESALKGVKLPASHASGASLYFINVLQRKVGGLGGIAKEDWRYAAARGAVQAGGSDRPRARSSPEGWAFFCPQRAMASVSTARGGMRTCGVQESGWTPCRPQPEH